MRIILPVLAMALIVPQVANAQPAHAKDKGKKHDNYERHYKHDRDDVDAGDVIIDTVFTALERELIGDYYRNNYGKKYDRSGLPPGLQKQLDRNGRLPPGLEGRDLPPGLAKKLPYREGTYRRVIDNDVYLIQRGTNLILDIIRDVIRQN